MIVTTTNGVEGKKTVEYLGLVNGEAILGAHVFKDIFAGFRDFFGGRSGSYEKTLKEARDVALEELQKEAESLGANAVVGVDVDYEIIGEKGSMIMVAISGTAVKIQ